MRVLRRSLGMFSLVSKNTRARWRSTRDARSAARTCRNTENALLRFAALLKS